MPDVDIAAAAGSTVKFSVVIVCALTVFTTSVVAVKVSAMRLPKWNIPLSIATPKDENQSVMMLVTLVVETDSEDEASIDSMVFIRKSSS